MSIFSIFLKRTTGLPEIRLHRGLKNVANDVLNSYKAEVLEALDRGAKRVRLTAQLSTTDAAIRAILHDVVESLRVPLHVRVLAGVLIDTIYLGAARDAGTEALLTAFDAEVGRIKRQILGARL